MNEYYILRRGNFATNANTKINYGLFTLLLCLEEYLTLNKTDCFNIMINSTFIWSFIEAILHITFTRIIKPMHLTIFNNTYKVPIYFGIFLQGFQEGGCITTIGLYFGDRLHIKKYFIFLHFIIIFIIRSVNNRELHDKISSKRMVNTPMSISLMSLVTLYNSVKLYLNPSHIERAMKMFFIMIYVSTFWTLIAWYKGFRNVIVYKQILTKKIDIVNNYNTFFVLGYDVIFEIGMAYLFFYCYYMPNLYNMVY